MKEVKIGNQIWSAENLKIDDGGEGIYPHKGEVFYTYDAAVRVAKSVKGWHLPTKEDFKELLRKADFKILTDENGFNALPAGYYDDRNFYDGGNGAYFWGSSEDGSYDVYYMHLYCCSEYADVVYYDSKYYGFSVRLIKDEEA